MLSASSQEANHIPLSTCWAWHSAWLVASSSCDTSTANSRWTRIVWIGSKLYWPFSRARAIHVMLVYTGGCNGCDIEIVNSILSPRFDAEQYNVFLTWNPREADVLVVTGPVTHLNRKPLEAIYEAIPNPKLVVAAGSCALMGGVYKNCYGDIPSEEIEGPVENIIPVNAKIPGCAVRPQDVLAGVVSLLPILLDAD